MNNGIEATVISNFHYFEMSVFPTGYAHLILGEDTMPEYKSATLIKRENKEENDGMGMDRADDVVRLGIGGHHSASYLYWMLCASVA